MGSPSLQGVFTYASYGGYGGQRIEKGERAYQFTTGQETNWLAFDFVFKDSVKFLPFQPFEFRLNASGVKEIFAALRKDIVTYLRDVEREQPLLEEIRQELDGLSSVIASKTGA